MMQPLATIRGWFTKAAPPTALSPVDTRGSFWALVRESFTGAWQQNVEVNQDTVASYWAVFACVTLIAGDISKLQPKVMELQKNGIWKDTRNRPVLRKPNHFQTRAEFIVSWVVSKLLAGNVYALKERDERGFITKLFVLDPKRVLPLVAPDGSVFYQLGADPLSGVQMDLPAVPASEIIHDKMYCLFHPLVGVSPIYACGISAMQGSAIQKNSFRFFDNMSRPSGILTAPAAISTETAERLKTQWEANFGAGKLGKVAVLGDGLKYEQMSITAVDSQLIEQLKMTAEMIAACFHVPGYKIGVGQMPTVNNTASLNQQYYDQCLQFIIETMELRLDDGLELKDGFETWFDLSGLLRMDPDTRHKSHSEAVRGGWKSPNEARLEENMEPAAGGDTPYLQQQNFALSALADRDKKAIEDDGASDVQATAMNGAQVMSLQELISAVARGEMPKDTAKATIAAAFPLLTTEQIDSMIDPIEEGSVTPPAPSGTPALPAPEEDAPDEETEAREFIEQFTKALAA